MSPRQIIELLALAALWGASFLFMRLGAGEFGPVALSWLRVVLASLALLPLLAWHGGYAPLRTHWRMLAVVGLVNSALPFLAYAFAATRISAGLSAIFNATTPLWGTLVGWLWWSERPARERLLGLAIGFAGVAWLVWEKVRLPGGAAAAIVACLLATLCYAVAAHLAKRRLSGVPPLAVAAGSQAAAAAALTVPGIALWPSQMPGPTAWWAVLALGVACTGLAYLLYFRLIAHIGATRAVTVTFLIPAFAVGWGWLFLAEAVTPVMVIACAVILLGTAVATGVVSLPGRRRPAAD